MIVYKRKVSHSIGKFLLAAMIFVLAMTITWDEVEGNPINDNMIELSSPIIK